MDLLPCVLFDQGGSICRDVIHGRTLLRRSREHGRKHCFQKVVMILVQAL